MVDVVDSYQYKDNQPGDEDAFATEPYAVRFRCRNTGKVWHRCAVIVYHLSVTNYG